jgi:hypothetical protein
MSKHRELEERGREERNDKRQEEVNKKIDGDRNFFLRETDYNKDRERQSD